MIKPNPLILFHIVLQSGTQSQLYNQIPVKPSRNWRYVSYHILVVIQNELLGQPYPKVNKNFHILVVSSRMLYRQTTNPTNIKNKLYYFSFYLFIYERINNCSLVYPPRHYSKSQDATWFFAHYKLVHNWNMGSKLQQFSVWSGDRRHALLVFIWIPKLLQLTKRIHTRFRFKMFPRIQGYLASCQMTADG